MTTATTKTTGTCNDPTWTFESGYRTKVVWSAGERYRLIERCKVIYHRDDWGETIVWGETEMYSIDRESGMETFLGYV